MTKLTIEESQLVEQNHNLIYSFMQKYNLQCDDWYGLISIGLIKAAMNFKPGNTAFSTYAYRCMYGEMRNELVHINRYFPEMLSLNYEFDNGKDGTYSLGDAIPDTNFDIERHYELTELRGFFDENIKDDSFKEVLELLSDGIPKTEIIEKTGISRYRIDKYLDNLRKSYLEFSNRPSGRLSKKQEQNQNNDPEHENNIVPIKEYRYPAGCKIKIPGDRKRYIVRARDDRYIICTQDQYHLIIDLEEGRYGPDNLIFDEPYETDNDCNMRLKQLQRGELKVCSKYGRKIDFDVA